MSARDFAPFPVTMRAPCLWYRREPNGPLYNWPLARNESVGAAHFALCARSDIAEVVSEVSAWKR